MNRRMWILAAAVALLASVGVFALDVLSPGDSPPARLVLARKAAMQAIFANAGDMNAKLAAGNIKGIAVNARSMAVIGTFLPTAFSGTYLDAYPAGYKFFFKGGPIADFQAKAQVFVTAVETIATLAAKEDKAGVEAQLGTLGGACGACHALYRGQN